VDVKKITDTFTLAVPVLVICSCIRLITYYQHWNIPILEYLSASELVLLFIQPVLVIAGLAAIYLAFNLGLAGIALLLVQLGVVKANKEKKAATQTESSRPSKKTHPLYAWIITILWIGMMIAFFFKGIWFDFEVVPTVLFHVFLLLGTAVAVRGLLPSGEKDDKIKPLSTATIVVLMSASFFYGRYQAHSTELHPANVRIALKDQALLDTNANRIYLGKTSNYYFFHNPTDGETSIIPVGEVRATYVR
jgi:hypothetical protein